MYKKFKSDFYIEIQRHKDEREKEFEKLNLNLSYKIKIPIIATHEVFYLDQSMHEAHDALLCIKNKTYINDKQRLKLSNNFLSKLAQPVVTCPFLSFIAFSLAAGSFQ